MEKDGFTKWWNQYPSTGRNDLPELLENDFREGNITDLELAEILLNVWTLCEFPSIMLHPEVWVEMFEATGFITDGPEMPTEALVIYRGCAIGQEDGMSWTTNENLAHWFAKRFASAFPSVVLKLEVEPSHILARSHNADGRQEHEVIINTFETDIAEVVATY